MGTRVVLAPDGRQWSVDRRWTRWTLWRLRADGAGLWQRVRRRLQWSRQGMELSGQVLEAAEIGELGEIPVIGVVFLAIGLALLLGAAVVFGVLVVVPLLIALVESTLLAVVALVGLVATVLLRRPCVIEAKADDGTTLGWTAVGWLASRTRRNEIAELLAAGITPPGAAVSREHDPVPKRQPPDLD